MECNDCWHKKCSTTGDCVHLGADLCVRIARDIQVIHSFLPTNYNLLSNIPVIFNEATNLSLGSIFLQEKKDL